MTQPLGPFSTYDATPPQQPSGVTFNGCAKANDPNPNAPPLNPTTDPSASEYNQLCSLAVAYGTMLPTARIVVASSNSITSVVSAVQSVSGNLAAFTQTGSAGNYIFEWTISQLLPSVRSVPMAALHATLGAHNYAISAKYVTGPNGRQAVEVYTTVDGALADVFPFSVEFR